MGNTTVNVTNTIHSAGTYHLTVLVRGITGQISKSGTRAPTREYYAWWSQEFLVSTN